MKPTVSFSVQQGSFLLEALIGVVIFALGVLTMICRQMRSRFSPMRNTASRPPIWQTRFSGRSI